MSIEPNETALLIAFARAASKAQEIEAVFRDSVIAALVLGDLAAKVRMDIAAGTRVRSLEDIARKIDRLPLGVLKEKFFKAFGHALSDPGVKEMFDAVNDERIFLMHNFFQAFPVDKLNGNKEAAIRLEKIDEILGRGLQIFRRAHEPAFLFGKIPPTTLREMLKLVVDA